MWAALPVMALGGAGAEQACMREGCSLQTKQERLGAWGPRPPQSSEGCGLTAPQQPGHPQGHQVT